MSELDQIERITAIDPQSMWRLLETFPEQVRSASEIIRSSSLSVPTGIDKVILAGMGGSAIGGDVVRSALGGALRVPFLVCRDYRLPGIVNPSSLVIACSYSGDTEETLSAYEQASRACAPIICIASGGQLAEIAENDKRPLIAVPDGLAPRAALGYLSIAILEILHVLWLAPDMAGAVEETAELLTMMSGQLSCGVPEERNRAKALARSLHGKVVAIYAATGLLDAAAARWRGQIEENAKTLASHHLLPEMNHNELVGWQLPEETLGKIGVVLLRDREDHPRVHRRFDLTRDVVARRAAVVHEVWSEGSSALARLFSVVYLGDFTSIYLAYLNGVDPTPVNVIVHLKQKLGELQE